MRDHYRAGVAMTLIALSTTVYSTAQEKPSAPAPTEQPQDNSVRTPGGSPREPTVTIFDQHDVRGILGREVRSAANENMGRIVDVLVDQTSQVRAAIIDFGGFLGVGSRKIAVAWDALRFPSSEDKVERIVLELTRDQVRAAPEFKQDRSVVVLGPSGGLESLP